MLPRRRHSDLRASLVRMLVVLGALLSLCTSTLTAQSAALGVTFARACAAETARTYPNEARLRAEREDARASDAHALVPSSRSVEAVLRRVRDHGRSDHGLDGARLAVTLSSETRSGAQGRDDAVEVAPAVALLPIDPPTRARARLMVFLN